MENRDMQDRNAASLSHQGSSEPQLRRRSSSLGRMAAPAASDQPPGGHRSSSHHKAVIPELRLPPHKYEVQGPPSKQGSVPPTKMTVNKKSLDQLQELLEQEDVSRESRSRERRSGGGNR